MPEYKEPYVSEVAEEANRSILGNDRGRAAHQLPQTKKESSLAPSDRSEPVGINEVSPELVALLSEKIKREVMEALGRQPLPNDSVPPILEDQTYSIQREPSHRSASTPSPPAHEERVYTPPSPTHNTRRRPSSPTPLPQSDFASPDPTASMTKEKEGVRFKDSRPSQNDPGIGSGDRRTRASQLPRTFSTAELTTIDQKWGNLFDREKEPTPRLGQILRGIANHMVEDFEPRKSIVVPPQKMAEFYARFPLDKELYPFLRIFQSECNANISQLYRDLRCEHHLVTAGSLSQAPSIPALTPNGFANWLTLFIVSYPNAEHGRLEKIVTALPIDADGCLMDGKPERLPKQISRHLLPNSENTSRETEVREAISDFMHESGLSKPRRHDSTVITPTGKGTSGSVPSFVTQSRPVDIPSSRPIERERMPYANSAYVDDSAVEDEKPMSASATAERERAPYTAHPGNGKSYFNADGHNVTINNSSTRSERTDSMSSGGRSRRDTDEYTTTRRESRAARDYAPAGRPVSTYRPPSPGVSTHPARSSMPINLHSAATEKDHRDARYSAASMGTPATYSSSGGFAPDIVGDGRNDKPRERERERERDERRFSGRSRRDTLDERSAPSKAELNVPRESEGYDKVDEERYRSSSKYGDGYTRY